MGCNLSFPIVRERICYAIPEHYNATGDHVVQNEQGDTKWVGIVILHFIKDLLTQRAAITIARKKFLETDYEKLQIQYPNWTTEDMIGIKSQFQSFDRNHDGLIDFEEMVRGLDELGDKTTYEERKENFVTIDADNSGAVDFEEYLGVIAKTMQHDSPMFASSDVISTGNINKLTIPQQIEYGFF